MTDERKEFYLDIAKQHFNCECLREGKLPHIRKKIVFTCENCKFFIEFEEGAPELKEFENWMEGR